MRPIGMKLVGEKPFGNRPIGSLVVFASMMTPTGTAFAGQTPRVASVVQAPVVFSGGHDTDPRDRGRPVVLVAGALGVPPDVFREAFRHVHPAPAGTEPDPRQVRDNKTALLDALGRYGVTNDRLDTVSNYYRYVRSRGALWPTKPATAYAVVKDGVITGFVITSGGSGYSSPPTISVQNIPGVAARAQLTFGTAFDKNGSISAITLVPAKEGDAPTKAPVSAGPGGDAPGTNRSGNRPPGSH